MEADGGWGTSEVGEEGTVWQSQSGEGCCGPIYLSYDFAAELG